jgi:hypothetical protein
MCTAANGSFSCKCAEGFEGPTCAISKLPPPKELTLIAGQATPGSADGVGAAASFNNVQGVVSDGDFIYATDGTNHTIRKIVAATGAVTTLAGSPGQLGTADGIGSAARFKYPAHLVADGAGNLYVTDTNNFKIRKIVIATGEVSSLAGTGAPGSADGVGAAASFNNPYGIAIDGAGNLYVADNNSRTIRKIVIATATVTTLAGQAGASGSADGIGSAARFAFPLGVVADGSGNLYVADATPNDTIRKIVIATGEVTTLAGTAGMTGSSDGVGGAARFNYPDGMCLDGSGNLWVADLKNPTIRKIALASKTVTTPIGVAGKKGVMLGMLPAQLEVPFAVACVGTSLLIADQHLLLRASNP